MKVINFSVKPQYVKQTDTLEKFPDGKGIENRASICPLIIIAKPETIAFTWNVGIGNSTGIGFGAIS